MQRNGRGLYVGGRAAQCGSNECRGGAHCNHDVATVGRGGDVMGKSDAGVY